MKVTLLFACFTFSVLLSTGQILLKIAATDVRTKFASGWWQACLSGWLALAIILYVITTALWLWVLAHLPLSRAYPFALLGAALVPLTAWMFLREPLSPGYLIGMALVLCGIAVIHMA